MNKPLSLVLVLSVLASMGYAQSNNLDAEVDAELNQMYQSSAPAKTEPQISTVTIPNESVVNTNSQTQSASASAVNSQPIYIVNQKLAAPAPQVQTQPTVTIEASPLIDSRAENLRRARQDAEMSTEAKIVEKLEQSRLEDEKRRAQVLFGDKLSGQNPEAAVAPVAPQAPAPAPQPQIIIIPQQAPAPAPVAAPVVETKTEAAVEVPAEKEVEATLKTELSMPLEVVPHVPVAQKYFSGLIGVSEIDSSAVQANYTLGFTYGTKYDDAYAVEGTFMYSNSEVENVNNQYSFYYGPQVNLFDMNQYSGSMAVKYFLLNGMVKPVIGGLGQYSYREFQWSDKNGYSRSLSRSSSHAFDIGALMGVEIEFSPKMKMGFDVRYLKNIAVNRDYSTDQLRYSGGAPLTAQQIADADFGYRTPIEELSAYSYTFNFTVNF